MSQVEVVRTTRRIKKDYTKLNLSSKYQENDNKRITSKRRKCYSNNRKNKQNDQSGSQQKQLKDNVLQRCLELPEAVPQQVLAFLDKNEKCMTPLKLQIQFPSQCEYSASMQSARKIIDLQEETIKDLVGANSNQSLFDFMTKKNNKSPSNSADCDKGQQENYINERTPQLKSKHSQNSQHTIEHLKQNLQYKINPQFIKSELKKEMMQKEALKQQNNFKNSVLENNNINQKYNTQYEGIAQERQIVLETNNKESLFDGEQKLSPKYANITTTIGISRRNTAPSTPNEPLRLPLRQYSVQLNNIGQYYYPLIQDGEITQFGNYQQGGEILSNLGDIKESSYAYAIQDNSYQPYTNSWSKDSRETTRMVIDEQQFNTHETYHHHIHHVDNCLQMPLIDSQHPQAQAEDILQAIDCQESFSNNYHGNNFYNYNHLEASPVRLSCHGHMINEQNHFGSNIHTEFD